MKRWDFQQEHDPKFTAIWNRLVSKFLFIYGSFYEIPIKVWIEIKQQVIQLYENERIPEASKVCQAKDETLDKE